MKKILVFDYSLGNIASVINSLEYLNFEYQLVNHYLNDINFDEIFGFILPGVGSFPVGMKNLKERKLDMLIIDLMNKNIPGLGICLGMQLLTEWSLEGGEKVHGLGLFKGGVIEIDRKYSKVPHIGWTATETKKKNWTQIFNGDFYYVHSYSVVLENQNEVLATFNHGKKNYSAAIYKKNLLGVQFHPEKSQEKGLKLIKNYFNLF